MFAHCLVCHAPFPPGALVEHFPVGRRIAYDPGRGRLWAVCDACGGWTLAPLAQRWEALEELERIVTTRGTRGARLTSRTENVALFRAGRSEVIRVGPTHLLEEAAWRYGRATAKAAGANEANPFAPRRLTLRETWLGVRYLLRAAGEGKHLKGQRGEMRRWVRFGGVAWRGSRACRACGHILEELSFFQCRSLVLRDAGPDGPTPGLVRACPRCRDEGEGGLHLEGTPAAFVLRRVLARQQINGNPPAHLRAAAHLIELGGGAAGLSSMLARYGRYLSDLPITSAVALRVLADGAYERHLLSLEAASVERQWRREEELASIVDGDLTDVPALDKLRIRLRGAS
ncbi:MAG TPA: hypothetical protein VJ997_03860 [Longimicrobiales bacterium]|nr:hypothetical protein [Longimicrobiales bacterium]